MPAAETNQPRLRQSPADTDLEASWLASKLDSEALKKLWQTHGVQLLKVSARVADPNEMEQTLATASQTDANAGQIALEQSAFAGNVVLFQHLLQHLPEPLLGKKLRLNAITGGVEIWRALLAHNHECIDWEIGEQGDALGQAVVKRKTDLVRFLLEEGISVRNSNFIGTPVLQAARTVGSSAEIIHLLVQHGAPE